MTAKSLFIGSSGRIGRMVLRAWRASDAAWRNDPAQYRSAPATESGNDVIWDVADGPAPLARWSEENGAITCLVVLAGTTPATGADMDDNVIIARSYLDAAQSLGVRRVLLASSSAVYGAGSGTAMAEDAPCTPLNAYGASKLRMEQAARPFRDAGLEVCCLRIGNVAGADSLLLNAPQVSAESPLRIDCFADGHGPQRSYIGPEGMGHVLGHLSRHEGRLPFLLNVAAPRPVHMDELADAAGLAWVAQTAPPHVHQRIVLDCNRLAKFVELPPDMGSARRLIAEWKRYG